MVTIPPGAVVVLLEVAVVGGSVDKVLGEVDVPVVDVLALVSEVPVVEVPELVEVGPVADVVGVVVVVEVEVEELEVGGGGGLGDNGIGTSARFLYKGDVIKYNACGSRTSYCPERAADEVNEQNQKQVKKGGLTDGHGKEREGGR
jgi:hypothetical protein